jgi:hypothetical protein
MMICVDTLAIDPYLSATQQPVDVAFRDALETFD